MARDPSGPRIIHGERCWGLGFLDRQRRLVGCLLHPAERGGRDLRDLTGYGEKCRRELCREARVFSRLTAAEARWLIGLCAGMDSFVYSSDLENPVFSLLRWGEAVIAALRAEIPAADLSVFKRGYGRFLSGLCPDRDGYALGRLLERRSLSELASPDFLAEYRRKRDSFIARRKLNFRPPLDNRPFVHQLEQPEAWVRFLRSALNRPRLTPGEAEGLRLDMEEVLADL